MNCVFKHKLSNVTGNVHVMYIYMTRCQSSLGSINILMGMSTSSTWILSF